MKAEDVPEDLFWRVAVCFPLEPTARFSESAVREALGAIAEWGAAAERESCAKVADAFPARTHGALATAPYAAAEQAADEIAAAIRSRTGDK